jgi:hypothetical protein
MRWTEARAPHDALVRSSGGRSGRRGEPAVVFDV